MVLNAGANADRGPAPTGTLVHWEHLTLRRVLGPDQLDNLVVVVALDEVVDLKGPYSLEGETPARHQVLHAVEHRCDLVGIDGDADWKIGHTIADEVSNVGPRRPALCSLCPMNQPTTQPGLVAPK